MSYLSRMTHSRIHLAWLCISILSTGLLSFHQTAFAQQTPPPTQQPVTVNQELSVSNNLTEQYIKERLEQVTDAVDLDEDMKAKAIKSLESALADFKLLADSEKKIKLFKQQTENDVTNDEQLKQQFESLPKEVSAELIINPTASLDMLEEQLKKVESELADLEDELVNINDEIKRRRVLRESFENNKRGAKDRLDKVNQTLLIPVDQKKLIVIG